MSRSKPPRLGTPVVRNQAGRLFHRSTRVPLVFPAPNLRAWDHRSSANKRDACSTVAHASRLCSPPPTSAKGQGRGWTRGAGHLAAVAADCFQGGDAEALAPANLRQQEPSGLANRGAREWRRARVWRRTLRAKSIRTGGSASQHGTNSPKNSPDALPCPADAGGGRNHDVEALRNMMTIRAKRGWTGTK